MAFSNKNRLPTNAHAMKLHWSPRSPFVRKVMIVLHETGLVDRVECVRNVVGMNQPNEHVLIDNPLNKIPTMVLADGRVLFDSRVICEYLDGLHEGPRLIPEDGSAYFQAMTWQSLGDGFIDLLLLWRNWHIHRGLAYDNADDPYLSTFSLKSQRTLCALEALAPTLQDTDLNIGHIAIACTLGHLDFRWEFLDWRKDSPQLAAWYRDFSRRPSAIATLVRNDETIITR